MTGLPRGRLESRLMRPARFRRSEPLAQRKGLGHQPGPIGAAEHVQIAEAHAGDGADSSLPVQSCLAGSASILRNAARPAAHRSAAKGQQCAESPVASASRLAEPPFPATRPGRSAGGSGEPCRHAACVACGYPLLDTPLQNQMVGRNSLGGRMISSPATNSGGILPAAKIEDNRSSLPAVDRPYLESAAVGRRHVPYPAGVALALPFGPATFSGTGLQHAVVPGKSLPLPGSRAKIHPPAQQFRLVVGQQTGRSPGNVKSSFGRPGYVR